MSRQIHRIYQASATRSFNTSSSRTQPPKPSIIPSNLGDRITTNRWNPHPWPKHTINPSEPPNLTDLIKNTSCDRSAYTLDSNGYIWTPPQNYKSQYPNCQNWDPHHRAILQRWMEIGPPPLSEYRLTFGKYKRKKLDEVPEDYLFGFLIKRGRGKRGGYCPLLGIALQDYMRRVPEVAKKAGLGNTEEMGKTSVRTGVKVGRKKKLPYLPYGEYSSIDWSVIGPKMFRPIRRYRKATVP